MRGIILVDPVSSGIPLKRLARELGYHVIAVFPYSMDYYRRIYRISQEVLQQECDAMIWSADIGDILETLQKSPFSVQGCIPCSEGGVELSALLSSKLQLKGNSLHSATICKDKGKMRKALKEKGLACPGFTLVYTEKEVREFALRHPFPLVIKSARGAGSAGVFICEEIEELVSRFYAIVGNENLFADMQTHAILEEYIGGIEYIVDTFSDGEQIHVTDVWKYEKESTKHFRNRVVYSLLLLPEDPSFQKIAAYGKMLASAFQVDRGAAHIELKDDPNKGPVMIEIGERLCGAGIPEMIRKHSNLDLYKATIEVFTKGKTTLPHPICFQKQLAFCFFSSDVRGKIQAIEGLSAIQALASYDHHKIFVAVGDEIQETTHLFTHPGYVVLANADPKALLHDIHLVKKLFAVKVTQ